MTDDDILDLMHGNRPLTAREIARHFKRAEDAVGRKLRLLIPSGLVEEGPRRPLYEGARGQPQKTYQLVRTKKVAA